MKHFAKLNYLLLTAILTGGILIGCDNAEYDTFGKHVFIKEALKATSSKVTVPVTGEIEATVCVGMSEVATEDNYYTFVVDPSVLEEYNRVNGTGYIPLPAEQVTLPKEVVIKANTYDSGDVPLIIKAFTEEMMGSGESYALPLRVVAKNGSVPVMENTGCFVVLANSIIKFSAPMFDGGADLHADKFGDSPEIYSQYTVEIRFQISNTADRDRAVFVNRGDDNSFVLLRFEDPQSDNSDHKAHSLVQVVGRNRLYLNPKHSFVPNKWQHLALTCDGSKYSLYINGEYSGSLEIPAGATTFSDVNWFCKGDDSWSRWRGCKILMSEARIWSVCRTQMQIQNNMTMVSPKSPGLEAYWRFNEGSGKEFQDFTGNGHTLKTSTNPVWISDILSTDEATPWE